MCALCHSRADGTRNPTEATRNFQPLDEVTPPVSLHGADDPNQHVNSLMAAVREYDERGPFRLRSPSN